MPTFNDILALVGLAQIVVGAGMIYVPAAFILAGATCFAMAALTAKKGDS